MATPAVLMNQARCFDSCVPPGMQSSVSIYLLAQIALTYNPGLDVTPTALVNAARCFDCNIPPGMQGPVMTYLMDQILTNCGGGGGGGAESVLWIVWEAAHSDDNPPVNPTRSVQRRFLNGDPPVIWNPALSLWL